MKEYPKAVIVGSWPNESFPGATIVEVSCPFCFETHTHGLPDGRFEVGETRVPHCVEVGSGNNIYQLAIPPCPF